MKLTITQLMIRLQREFAIHGDINVLIRNEEFDVVSEISEITAVRFNKHGHYSNKDNADIKLYPEVGVILE